MKMNVPIYLANVTIKVTKRTGRSRSENRYVYLKEAIVKGFTKKDIARRKQSMADKHIQNPDIERASIVGLELLSQHGYGVND